MESCRRFGPHVAASKVPKRFKWVLKESSDMSSTSSCPPQKKNQLKWHEMATCCRKEPLQVTDLCNYESIAHRFTNYPGVVPSKWLLQVSEWIYSYLRFIPLIPCEGPARNLPFTLGSWFGRSFFCQDWRVQWWSWIQLSCKNSRSYTPAHPFFKQNMTNYGIYYHCAIVYSYSICNI